MQVKCASCKKLKNKSDCILFDKVNYFGEMVPPDPRFHKYQCSDCYNEVTIKIIKDNEKRYSNQ